MNIGDLVRSLHGNEEGFITKIIDSDTIEIEIEDGFTMPILKRDVVLVKKEEAEHFDSGSTEKQSTPSKSKPISDVGIFLAFVPSTQNLSDLHIINNTDYSLLATIHQVYDGDQKGVFSGEIATKQSSLINKWSMKDFDHWGSIQVNILFYQAGKTIPKSALEVVISFQAKQFYNNYGSIPVMSGEGHVYRLDNRSPVKAINIKTASETNLSSISRPQKIIDLHLDKLNNTHQTLAGRDALNHQMQVFESALEAAIATGMDEITFIHGVGNQVLKSAIAKALSQHPQIDYFQDAQKSKFGYGATYIKL